jgi:hypothetical protein
MTPVIRTVNVDSAKGQESLGLLRKKIESGEIKQTESNGNIQYSNEDLDKTVSPLLQSLNLQVRRLP